MLIFGAALLGMLSEESLSQGGIMVFCTLLGGLGGKFIDRLSARDKIEFDARLQGLENSVKECENRHNECERAHGESLALIEKLRAETRERDERDKEEMRAEIAELRREQRANIDRAT